MGEHAEDMAKYFEVSREDQETFAMESHRKANAAIENGHSSYPNHEWQKGRQRQSGAFCDETRKTAEDATGVDKVAVRYRSHLFSLDGWCSPYC